MEPSEIMAFGLVTVAVYPDSRCASILCLSGWDEAYEGAPCPDWDAACEYLRGVAGGPTHIDHSQDWYPSDVGDSFVFRW